MPCPHCQDGPGSFVQDIMFGHAWGQLQVPDLPTLELNSQEVLNLLGNLVWTVSEPICMRDFAVGTVEVRETGITATIDISDDVCEEQALKEFQEYQKIGMIQTTIPLPDGVWDALKLLARSSVG
jgi:hypothetical protein